MSDRTMIKAIKAIKAASLPSDTTRAVQPLDAPADMLHEARPQT